MNTNENNELMNSKEIQLNDALKVAETSLNHYKYYISNYYDVQMKCENISYWLKKHANCLIKECERPAEKGKYISFPPGTLIKVDFGINFGRQICKPHFAIVLNKRDSSFNPILTVVPLTSKNKKYYESIGNQVYMTVIESLNKDAATIKKERDRIDNATNMYTYILNKINAEVADLPEGGKVYKADKEFGDYVISFIELLCSFADEEYSFADIMDKDLDERTKIMDNLIDILNEKKEQMTSDIKKHTKCVNYYEHFKENTYADVNQPTTISKERIMSRINCYDPMGSIRVDDETLNKIRQAVAKNII